MTFCFDFRFLSGSSAKKQGKNNDDIDYNTTTTDNKRPHSPKKNEQNDTDSSTTTNDQGDVNNSSGGSGFSDSFFSSFLTTSTPNRQSSNNTPSVTPSPSVKLKSDKSAFEIVETHETDHKSRSPKSETDTTTDISIEVNEANLGEGDSNSTVFFTPQTSRTEKKRTKEFVKSSETNESLNVDNSGDIDVSTQHNSLLDPRSVCSDSTDGIRNIVDERDDDRESSLKRSLTIETLTSTTADESDNEPRDNTENAQLIKPEILEPPDHSKGSVEDLPVEVNNAEELEDHSSDQQDEYNIQAMETEMLEDTGKDIPTDIKIPGTTNEDESEHNPSSTIEMSLVTQIFPSSSNTDNNETSCVIQQRASHPLADAQGLPLSETSTDTLQNYPTLSPETTSQNAKEMTGNGDCETVADAPDNVTDRIDASLLTQNKPANDWDSCDNRSNDSTIYLKRSASVDKEACIKGSNENDETTEAYRTEVDGRMGAVDQGRLDFLENVSCLFL